MQLTAEAFEAALRDFAADPDSLTFKVRWEDTLRSLEGAVRWDRLYAIEDAALDARVGGPAGREYHIRRAIDMFCADCANAA